MIPLVLMLSMEYGATTGSGALVRLDDPRSLRAPGLPVLLRQFHDASMDTGRVRHALPDTSRDVMAGLSVYHEGDTVLSVSPRIGIEWRNPAGEGGWATDFGGRIEGGTGRLSFWVEAAMISAEVPSSRKSWDGQYQEFQKEGAESRLTYVSFSRYEGLLTSRSSFGRVSMGRTREHWGPACAYPLALGSAAAPMPLVEWDLWMGNFRVRTLWASLAVDGAGVVRKDPHSRSLYGHRYEWLATDWLTLGVSEALFLYEREEPAALFPLAPLFMEKGQGLEDDNNGELSLDLELRPVRGWRLYGEFLVDDMSEPTSLFNNFWKNRWAATVGTQWATRWRGGDLGVIGEFSHVEPWVYTHYAPATAQASHQGVLLGNVNGPNSRSLRFIGYGARGWLHLESSLELVWKGQDLGSSWLDTLHDNESTRKTFLEGGGEMGCRGELHLGWSGYWMTVWLDLGKQFASVDVDAVRPAAPVALRVQGGW